MLWVSWSVPGGAQHLKNQGNLPILYVNSVVENREEKKYTCREGGKRKKRGENIQHAVIFAKNRNNRIFIDSTAKLTGRIRKNNIYYLFIITDNDYNENVSLGVSRNKTRGLQLRPISLSANKSTI